MIAAGTRPPRVMQTMAFHCRIDAGKPPGKRAGVAVELVPGDGKGLVGKGHGAHSSRRANAAGLQGMRAELAGKAGRLARALFVAGRVSATGRSATGMDCSTVRVTPPNRNSRSQEWL